ncbi:hypothetical protein [Haloarcula salina]|uniref:Uncharacterized protein n=1 Tax=Haloarcula salina TaxID=1429914 RepID=A0AA41G205_9EURY|nr:hypothetical protein [Haloarcula salina]MBV0902745.1 hypothetical protein [Haloarcula salina]
MADESSSTKDSPPIEESEQATRRTVLYLVLTALSFVIALLFERELFYRGYGEGGYGNDDYGG